MRVLVITMLYPGAQAPHRAGFMPGRLRALARHCTLSTVVPYPTFPRPWPLRSRPAPDPDPPGEALYRLPFCAVPGLGRNRRPRQILATLEPWAVAFAAAHPVDLVLGHFLYPDGVAAAAIAQRLDRPLVLVAHGSDVYQHCAVPARRAQAAAALARAQRLVVASDALRRHLLEFGLPAEAAVIPCGYDPARFAPRPQPEARSELGLPPGRWLVFVGMLRRVKRVDLLLDALAQLPPDVHLAVVGDGEERERLAARAARLGLTPRVRWAGPQPHERIPAWLAAADAVVLASDHEGTPTVLVEALAMGRPVVATAVGGIPDLVGEAGRLAPAGDAAGVAAAIAATLAAPPTAEALQARVAGLSSAQLAAREFAVLQAAASAYRGEHQPAGDQQ